MARTIAIIYKYHYYRVRVSVAHFSRDIMRLCWRVLACRACAMVCMYIDKYCLFRLWLVFSVWSAVGLFPLVLCCTMYALLSVVIWYNRAVMRCNRFSVSGGVVLPCALSCDCGAFY